jgi:type 1 glutamine amidotransferase
MRPIRIIAVVVLVALLAGVAAAQAPGKINVLIVTGQNNHDWRATTPVLKDILERSGQFTVTVNEHPEACTAADFAPFDVILSNYNGPRWGAVAEKAFLDFIRGGKGFVVIHAANNCFTDWPEYVALIGGIWAGQAGHGQRHPFLVRIVDRNHPITRAMSDFMHSTDELYHRLEMQPNIHLLATAYSAPDTGGTGRDEPIAWTVDYQGGRCFHNVLGHDVEGMQSAGFVALVQRGTEWAATGKVAAVTDAQTLIPRLGAGDEDTRYEAKAQLIGIGREAIAPLMEALTGPDKQIAAEARDALIWIAQRWAGTPEAPGIEEAVTQFAAASHPTVVRALAARMLGLMGDAPSAPLLIAMLKEPQVREDARQALMQIPGPQVTRELVQMLPTVDPEFEQDLLHALATRGDRSATPAVIAAAQSGNLGVRLAAVDALGRLGDGAAAQPLWGLATSGPVELRSSALNAYLRLADAMLAQRQFDRGFAMFRQALGAKESPPQRVATLIGLGRARRAEAAGDIQPFLRDADPRVQTAAAAALAETPGPQATAALAASLKGASQGMRVAILGFLGQRADKAATPVVIGEVSNADENVGMAAVAALGGIGDPSAEPALRKVISSGSQPMRAAAAKAYLDIADAQLEAGAKRDAARAYLYIANIAQAPEAKARALMGLGRAGDMGGLPAVKAALDAKDPAVAAAALEAYIQLGGAAATAGDEKRVLEIYTDALRRATGAPAEALAERINAMNLGIDVAALQGFVTNWWIIGPFPNANHEAWGKRHFPEEEIVLDKQYDLDGQKLAWQFHHTTNLDGVVALDQVLSPTDNKAAYMYAQVASPAAQQVKFKVGSDDAIKVWLNGQQVFANDVERGVEIDSDVFEASLKQGPNDILVEVFNGGGDWGAVLRITDMQDRPLALEQRKP